MTFNQKDLKSLRESRGWTVHQFAVLLLEEAKTSRSFRNSTVKSLERMIRRWQKGQPPMSDDYKKLCQRVFDRYEPLPPLPEEVKPVAAVIVQNSAAPMVTEREPELPAPADPRHELADPATSDAGFAQDVCEFLELMAERAIKSGLAPFLTPGGDVAQMAATVRMLGQVRQPWDWGDDEAPGWEDDEAPGWEVAYSSSSDLDLDDGDEELPQSWEQWRMCHRLVVLGDAGMGKSWLLRLEAQRLAEEAAAAWQGRLSAGAPVPVPILIRADVLADASGATLPEAVSGHLVRDGLLRARSQAQMERLIADGHAVLLIDGLDEVPREAPSGETQAPRKRLEDLLARWEERCPRPPRFVVTSRLAGYLPLPIRDIAEAELLPFTTSYINDVVEKWNLSSTDEEWLREQLSIPAVAKMAQVPLLLALICALAGDPRQRRRALPGSRVELYEELMWKFLSGEHRTSEHGAPAPALDETRREQLLQVLACVAFHFADAPQGWSDHLPYRDLATAVSAAAGTPGGPWGSPAEIIDLLARRVGILVPAGNPADGMQDYMFLHRTFAEYLVARYLHDLDAPARLAIVRRHQWFDPDWADWAVVMPMLGSLLDKNKPHEASALVTHFLNKRHDPRCWASCIAIRILGETSDPDRLLTSAQQRSLAKLIIVYSRSRNLFAALAEAYAWPSLVSECIFELSAEYHEDVVREAAVRALSGHAGQAATQALLGRLSDTDRRVSTAAVWALAWRDGQDVTDGLLGMLACDDASVRWEAGRALERRDGQDVTDGLLGMLANDHDSAGWEVGWVLQRRAGQDVIDGLLGMLTCEDARARNAARVVLEIRAGQDVTDGLLGLLTCEDARARETAIWMLSRRDGGQDVTDGLLGRLTDDDAGVRWEATWALRRRDGQDVTDGLLGRLADDDASIRFFAVSALAARDGQDVTRGLLGRLTDDSYVIRLMAARALASRDGKDVTEALRDRLADLDLNFRSVLLLRLRCLGVRAMKPRWSK